MLDMEHWLLDDEETLISLDKWQRTVDLLAELFDAPAGFLVQHTHLGYQVTIASNQESNPYPSGVVIEPDVNIFCRRIVETRKELYVSNAPKDPDWDTNPEVKNDGFVSYLGVPVYWPNGKPFGTFCVMDYKETNYTDSYLRLIRQLKDILESDLEILAVFDQMRKMAMTDDLTGLYNRRGFSTVAEQSILLAKRMGHNLTLIYFDVDEFKQINDEHGHAVGDEVLKGVADSLRHTFRESDTLGRLGGDEFTALVLSEQSGNIQVIQERFQDSLNHTLSGRGLPIVEASFGNIALEQEHVDIEEVLDIADARMYEHKRQKKQGL